MAAVLPESFDEEFYLDRIREALQLISLAVPYRMTRLQRDLRGVLCFGTGKNAALGAYVPMFRLCLIDPRHVADVGSTTVDLARTILHEANHARVHRRGRYGTERARSRVEHLCVRAEEDFLTKRRRMNSGGTPVPGDVVVEE